MFFRFDQNDAVSVDYLATSSEMQERILFYQPLSDENPFVIIYQNEEQMTKAKQFGKSLVFLDATYSGIKQFTFTILLFTS